MEDFFRAHESIDCLVVKKAIGLASHLLKADGCSVFILNYNIADSSIVPTILSFDHTLLELEMVLTGPDTPSCFNSLNIEYLVLNPSLIQVARQITRPDDSRYISLVFFLAMGLLSPRESTESSSGYAQNNNESSNHSEQYDTLLFGGCLSLDYSQPERLVLRLIPSIGEATIAIGSPNISASQPANTQHSLDEIPVRSILLTISSEQNRESDEACQLYRYKITLKNTSDITIYLPADQDLPGSAFRVTCHQLSSGQKKKMAPKFGCCKTAPYYCCEKVPVQPGESRSHIIDVRDYFTGLETEQSYQFDFKFQAMFYHDESKTTHRYCSNIYKLFLARKCMSHGQLATNSAIISLNNSSKAAFCFNII